MILPSLFFLVFADGENAYHTEEDPVMGMGDDGLEKYVEKEVVLEEERGVIDVAMRFSGAT